MSYVLNSTEEIRMGRDRKRIAEFRRSLYRAFGDHGLEELDYYGQMREREGTGAGLIICGLLVVVLVSAWPFLKAVLVGWLP